MKTAFFALFGLVFLAACTFSTVEKFENTSVPKNALPTDPSAVKIFDLERELPATFEKLGFVHVRSGTGNPKYALEVAQKKGAELGANGLLRMDRTFASGSMEERYLAIRF